MALRRALFHMILRRLFAAAGLIVNASASPCEDWLGGTTRRVFAAAFMEAAAVHAFVGISFRLPVA
jgi:hypothetical protein